MKSKQTTTTPMLYSIDAGNGAAKGISTEIESRGLISFEPLIAPITEKRGINRADEKPRFSLRVDDQILVFGVDDVFDHGRRTAARRLNSMSRYTSPDYFRLIDVLFLHLFAGYRGQAEPITPSGVISLPISEYNNPDTIDAVRAQLVGLHTIEDADGCLLRVQIDEKKLTILPESFGSLMHYLYNDKLLTRREDADASGSTLVVDIGYETTDLSWFDGTKYQRDRAFTLARSGVGTIARDIAEWTGQRVKGTDVSLIDRNMRNIAGLPTTADRWIEVAPGQRADIGPMYDVSISELAARIVQSVETQYAEAPTRILLAGGGAYHLAKQIEAQAGSRVTVAPDAEDANARGGLTTLKLKARK